MQTVQIIYNSILLLVILVANAEALVAQEVLTDRDLPVNKRDNYFKRATAILHDYYNSLPDAWGGDAELRGGFISHYYSDNAMLVPETPQGVKAKEFLDAGRYLIAMQAEYGRQAGYSFQVTDVECHPDMFKTSLFSCAVKVQYMLSVQKDGKLLSKGRKVATLEFPDLKLYFNVKVKQLEPNQGRSIMLDRYKSPDDDNDDRLEPEQVSALYNLAFSAYWDYGPGVSSDELHYRSQEGYMLLQFPEGTDGDRLKAFELFKKAAEHGHDKAMFYLGKYYRTGRYVPKDLNKAVYWLEKAAKTNFLACYELGKCYKELGRWTDAVKYFKRAAEEGFFYWACIHLVDIYTQGGHGVAASAEQRKYWNKEKKSLKKIREAMAGFKQEDKWAYLD